MLLHLLTIVNKNYRTGHFSFPNKQAIFSSPINLKIDHNCLDGSLIFEQWTERKKLVRFGGTVNVKRFAETRERVRNKSRRDRQRERESKKKT